LEALTGYLFITDTRRCHELLQWFQVNLELVVDDVAHELGGISDEVTEETIV
jgi:hypothetical protein